MPSPTEPKGGPRPPSAPGTAWVAVGAAAAALAVGLGAFGTHALEPRITPERLATWETATRYHLVHAVVLVALGALGGRVPGLRWVGGLLSAGVAVFSGSLYLLVLTDTPILGAVTPVGGVLLIAGWLTLAMAAVRGPR